MLLVQNAEGAADCLYVVQPHLCKSPDGYSVLLFHVKKGETVDSLYLEPVGCDDGRERQMLLYIGTTSGDT